MILHLLRMHRNVNRNVFDDWKNVSATTSTVNFFLQRDGLCKGRKLLRALCHPNFCSIPARGLPATGEEDAEDEPDDRRRRCGDRGSGDVTSTDNPAPDRSH